MAQEVFQRYDLKPMAFISYERTAYTCGSDEELRVTFDQDIDLLFEVR